MRYIEFEINIILFFLAIHAILVLLQAITLNVAFNSQNKMLLIIMLTNNVNIDFVILLNKIFLFLVY